MLLRNPLNNTDVTQEGGRLLEPFFRTISFFHTSDAERFQKQTDVIVFAFEVHPHETGTQIIITYKKYLDA